MNESTALEEDLGVYGDDMNELIEEYSKRFNVDVSDYRWYFHTGEEGVGLINIGGMISPPPDARVPHIPITIGMLSDFANKGRWSIVYPEHSLPERRHDLMINRWLGLILLALMSAIVIYKECR
jgi:hypothetical protein